MQLGALLLRWHCWLGHRRATAPSPLVTGTAFSPLCAKPGISSELSIFVQEHFRRKAPLCCALHLPRQHPDLQHSPAGSPPESSFQQSAQGAAQRPAGTDVGMLLSAKDHCVQSWASTKCIWLCWGLLVFQLSKAKLLRSEGRQERQRKACGQTVDVARAPLLKLQGQRVFSLVLFMN